MRRAKTHSTGNGNSLTSSETSSTSNPINIAEVDNKIQKLLVELHETVLETQRKRDVGAQGLERVTKTQDKIQNDGKLTQHYKQKIKSLYLTSLQDTEQECDVLRKGLKIIADIKAIQEEKRLSIKLSETYQSDHPRKTIRRGVLMSMLQKSAQTLPLWIGKPGESPPPLCGAISAPPDYISKPGEKVAARVKTQEGEEQWILAEVISYSTLTNKYEVDDIDDEGKECHTLSRRRVLPLPQWKANLHTDHDALFEKGTVVMALYPQTTCFYKAIIEEQPQNTHGDYTVLFEDNSYIDGYSPPLPAAQKYVVMSKQK